MNITQYRIKRRAVYVRGDTKYILAEDYLDKTGLGLGGVEVIFKMIKMNEPGSQYIIIDKTHAQSTPWFRNNGYEAQWIELEAEPVPTLTVKEENGKTIYEIDF